MFLQQLNLQNFRSFKEKQIIFSPRVNLIIGSNAVGKTNLLEALYLLSSGKSFRASKEEEMIFNKEEWSRIKVKLTNKEELNILLTKGKIQGKRTAKKIYKINQISKQWRNFVGHLHCVLFRPEDIDIILGSPSRRRNYLDLVLNQVDWQYRACHLAYKKALRQRNKLLSRIREGQASRSQLIFWNQMLIKNGELITQKRESLIRFLNDFLKDIFLVYDKSAISSARLEKYLQAEIALGMTLVGPQRDELLIFKKENNLQTKRNVALFGSRGEQRMAVMALKMAELAFIKKQTKSQTLLLLDDIFSELDINNRKGVIKAIFEQQVIITATEKGLLPKDQYAKMKIIQINKERTKK